jgi:hypothetical protein
VKPQTEENPMSSEREMKDVLVDQEDGPEEYAWVRVATADSPRAAVVLATEEEPLPDDLFYECSGRSWHRLREHGEDGVELWEPCAPDADGAVEFWDLIVAEPEVAAHA